MKKHITSKLVVFLLTCALLPCVVMAKKVVQIIKDSEIIGEFSISELDYIDIKPDETSDNIELHAFGNNTLLQVFGISDFDFFEINHILDAPFNLKASVAEKQVNITWEYFDDAVFDLYRSNDNTNFSLLAANVSDNTFTDTNPYPNINYYKIKAVNDYQESDFSSVIAVSVPYDEDTPTGIYLGIMGFNKYLYSYPIEKLDSDNATGFYNFVNNLQSPTEIGTILTYALEQSINTLQTTPLPSDLRTAAIVTFTDGLDQGSIAMSDGRYLDDEKYLNDIHKRLQTEKVATVPITAYSVGFEGNDINSSFERTLFSNTLTKIASQDDYAFKVSNINDLNNKLKELANELGESNFYQTIRLQIPIVSDGAIIRFTFDNINNAANSNLYIEGTMNLKENTFDNIKYVGMTATSGRKIKADVENRDFYLTFEGVHTNDNVRITQKNTILEWRYYDYGGGEWARNSEFQQDENAIILTKKYSAAIMLNLDCSISLGNDFERVKSTAKDFIKILVDNSVNPDEVSGVSLSQSSASLMKGQTITLKANVAPSTALLKDVKWSTTNSEVATVDDQGNVTAISPGTATVIATTVDGGFSATCQVTVIQLATSLQLNHSEIEIYIGDNKKLSAKIYPDNTTDKRVIWKSSDNRVATIDEDGTITPLNVGNATITATTADGTNLTASCALKVLQHVEEVKIDQEEVLVNVGKTKQLQAIVLPYEASNKNIIWHSSDETVATIDQDGLVSAVSRGTTQVSAISEDGGHAGICQVEVFQPAEDLSLNKSTLSIYIGDSETLIATVLPENANDRNVTWKSSRTDVAEVDDSGIITPVALGSTVITATTTDGTELSASCEVTVLRHVDSIVLNEHSLTLNTGDTRQLTATVIPLEASNNNISWKSSDESVVLTDQNGFITAIARGKAQITVFSEDGAKSDICEIEVIQPVESISLSKNILEVYNGETAKLEVTLLPSDANNKEVTWTSSNNDVATVDEAGNITPLKAGEIVVTVTSNDNPLLSASCKVTILQHAESVEIDLDNTTLNIGESKQLTATVLPADATNKKVVWSSTDPGIVSVDNTGFITGVARGNAKILVVTSDGKHEATCDVEVIQQAEGIILSHSTLELYNGETAKLTASVFPENANNKEVSWTSTTPSVASVNEDGEVTALKAGVTMIEVTSKDGSGKKASCKVTVLQHVESISFGQPSYTIAEGKQQYLDIEILPSNASNKTVIYTSKQPSIVKVENGLVTALQKGKATIIAESEDGGKTTECEIEVVKLVSDIVLNYTSASLKVGNTLQLNATVNPSEANDRSVTWTSSNPTSVSVSSTGLVQALAPGSSTITVKAQDGSNVEARCVISVSQPVTGISLSSTTLSVPKGSSGNLTVSITPATASVKTFTVSSSNTSVATVSQSGMNVYVTGIAFGTTTIEVKSQDGGYTATCDVTVTPSTTPSHLALALSKDGVKYYIPYSEYTSVPSGYSKLGVTVYNGTGFILSLSNSGTTTYSFTDGNKRGTLPTQTQAALISSNWTSINNAMTKYGGTSLGSNSYWTSTPRGTGEYGYYYNSSGVSLAGNSSARYYVRTITNF